VRFAFSSLLYRFCSSCTEAGSEEQAKKVRFWYGHGIQVNRSALCFPCEAAFWPKLVKMGEPFPAFYSFQKTNKMETFNKRILEGFLGKTGTGTCVKLRG
jgi:hypothetical protein